MTESNVVTAPAVARCSACKLPDDVLAALHADRLEGGVSLDSLARRYGLPERPLSESGLRRHFSRHVAEPEYSSISEETSAKNDLDGASTSFANPTGDDLDAHGLLEIGTRSLVGVVKALEREYGTAVQRNPQAVERVFDKLLKTHTLLARSVKQLQDGRSQREEFRKTVPRLVEKVTTEAARCIATLMRAIGKRLREDFTSVADERLSIDEFWNRLTQYENAWPIEVGTRMKAATTAALKAEEALAGDGQRGT